MRPIYNYECAAYPTALVVLLAVFALLGALSGSIPLIYYLYRRYRTRTRRRAPQAAPSCATSVACAAMETNVYAEQPSGCIKQAELLPLMSVSPSGLVPSAPPAPVPPILNALLPRTDGASPALAAPSAPFTAHPPASVAVPADGEDVYETVEECEFAYQVARAAPVPTGLVRII